MSDGTWVSIRNATVATVIGGIILLVIPSFRDFLFRTIVNLWSGVIWLWGKIFELYGLPGWAWLIVISFAIIGLVTIIFAIKETVKEPGHTSYIEDNIQGATWRWGWLNNRISNLWCYCTTCDAVLVYDDRSCRSYIDNRNQTNFICENCGNRIVTTIEGGNKSYALGMIEREIDRRVRLGKYPNTPQS